MRQAPPNQVRGCVKDGTFRVMHSTYIRLYIFACSMNAVIWLIGRSRHLSAEPPARSTMSTAGGKHDVGMSL